ncbi:MAG TPA: DoxX family protein [Candidatus Limnocylindrales bacterium]
MEPSDLGLLILRLVVGVTFAGHGAQKAFGWWNGPGLAGWRGAITHMGFQPVELFVALSIGAELVGGLLLAVGLFTPLASMILMGQLVVIISKAHLPKGFWSTNGGYEYPLALAASVVAITFIGAGSVSLDQALGFSFSDSLRAAYLLIGVIGGLVALGASRVAQPKAVRV